MNDNFHLSEDDKMTVLVSCEAPGVIQALEKRGVRVLTVDICEQLDVPVRSMQTCRFCRWMTAC